MTPAAGPDVTVRTGSRAIERRRLQPAAGVHDEDRAAEALRLQRVAEPLT